MLNQLLIFILETIIWADLNRVILKGVSNIQPTCLEKGLYVYILGPERVNKI